MENNSNIWFIVKKKGKGSFYIAQYPRGALVTHVCIVFQNQVQDECGRGRHICQSPDKTTFRHQRLPTVYIVIDRHKSHANYTVEIEAVVRCSFEMSQKKNE